MAQGLTPNDVVAVSVNLQPNAVPMRNFGALCIIGSSNVIDTGSRVRFYATLAGVAADFGVVAPEYLAAVSFFAQSPQPSALYIARWAQTASSAALNGGALSIAQQNALLTTLQGISAGSIKLTINGSVVTPATLNFSGIVTLNGAASVLQTGLPGTTVTWNAAYGRFQIQTVTTGPAATLSYATDNGTYTLATLMGLAQGAGAQAPVAGITSETPLQAVQAIATINSDDWALAFAAANGNPTYPSPTLADYLAIASYIEASSPTHVFGITTQDANTLNSGETTSLAYQLQAGKYSRTFIQYSSGSPFAICSFFGRASTVDFTATNTAITLMWKNEPTVTAETLNENQAAILLAKNVNVFVNYMNGVAIIQPGVMCDGTWFDVRQGTDWLQNAVQTAVFNLLYQSPTKIPQTDPGVHQILTVVSAALSQGVNNGLIAPGVWTSSLQFGQLQTGDFLPKGFYVYAAPVASQLASDRAARKAPAMQCAIKLSGAVHTANVAINVNQ